MSNISRLKNLENLDGLEYCTDYHRILEQGGGGIDPFSNWLPYNVDMLKLNNKKNIYIYIFFTKKRRYADFVPGCQKK